MGSTIVWHNKCYTGSTENKLKKNKVNLYTKYNGIA